MHTPTVSGLTYIGVVPAAGIGSRMQADKPKQYLTIAEKTILEHSIEALLQHPDIAQVVVALHPDDQWFERLEMAHDTRVQTVTGGDTRADSVSLALAFIRQHSEDWANQQVAVVVHDAARPCLCLSDLSRLLDTFAQAPAQGALLAAPVRDTMKRSDAEQQVVATVEREQLWHAQTPQVALADVLDDALQRFASEVTDEASALQLAGLTPRIVAGQASNIKVTHHEDLQIARNHLLASQRQPKDTPMFRIGQGFDVHKFGGPGPVTLGGVAIEHHQGLLAHSDGDVLLHALSDALLGALALGDIGHLFPDTDPQFKGADSKVLLQEVYRRITAQGYRLVNADVTVMAETPKLKPHNQAIRQSIASALGVAIEQVSVKATTTEKLGFTGREEGIACQAVVLIQQTSSTKDSNDL